MSEQSKMKFVCQYKAGSHSYGLVTPTSDEDVRGVFLHTDVKHILGLEKFEHHTDASQEDTKYREYRSALQLLKRGNTEMVEALYHDDFLVNDEVWLRTQKYKSQLVSSEQLFKCLLGYMQGEYRLAIGERTGKLGSKRKTALEKYGFSPKNFVQLFRLATAGQVFFQEGYFPVKLTGEFRDELYKIKTEPHLYTKEQLTEKYLTAEAILKNTFEHRKFDYKYDDDVANWLVLKAYGPMVVEELEQPRYDLSRKLS